MNCKEFLALSNEEQSELIGKVVLGLQYSPELFLDAVKMAAKYDALHLPHKPLLTAEITHEIGADLKDIDNPIEKGGMTINY